MDEEEVEQLRDYMRARAELFERLRAGEITSELLRTFTEPSMLYVVDGTETNN